MTEMDFYDQWRFEIEWQHRTDDRDHHERIDWGEPNSQRRKLMVGGLMAELRTHLGSYGLERDRSRFETCDAEMLDRMRDLIQMWNREAEANR